MKYKYPKLNAEMPSKDETKELMANQFVRGILEDLEANSIETAFDRHESQQPQCLFGLRGLCCQRCLWGPCRIVPDDPRKSRGICGATLELVVMGNLLRSLAAGCAAHTQHALESTHLLAAAARSRTLPLVGEESLAEVADRLGISRREKSTRELACEIADVFLEDIIRTSSGSTLRVIEAFAPRDRLAVWNDLGILPRGTYYEIVESLHRTTLGGCTDWRELALQDLRTALAYSWSALFASSLATEIVFGAPRVSEVSIGYQILGEEHVNIAIHGHSPILAEYVVSRSRDAESVRAARAAGAKGITVVGLCCSGLELLARRGVPTLGNILGQEIVIGSGLVDLLVADMQCVIPGLSQIAKCFDTTIVTTSESDRIADAVHIPVDFDTVERDAVRIVDLAIEAHRRRRPRTRADRLRTTGVKAKVGYDHRTILSVLGGARGAVELLRGGQVKGIVTVVGCNNPKVPYERSQVTIAKELIKDNIMVTTSGCCAHALLASGLCSPESWTLAGESLGPLCKERGFPPVLNVGACVDNVRTIRLFTELAAAASLPMDKMPFMFSGPEPGSEKAIGQALSFLLLGVNVHSGFPAGVPVPVPKRTEGSEHIDDYERGGNQLVDFFVDQAHDLLGARLLVEPYPDLAAKLIQMTIRRKRLQLEKEFGWKA